VDRGGEEVRYVIDYYHDESAVDEGEGSGVIKGAGTGLGRASPILVDVRPALDSFQALTDRLTMFWRTRTQTGMEYRPVPFFASASMKSAELREEQLLQQRWAAIRDTCATHKQQLHALCGTGGSQGEGEGGSKEKCGALAVELQRCTASVVCPNLVTDFDKCVAQTRIKKSNTAANNDLAAVEVAYNKMTKCLELFEVESRKFLSKK
jgi:hypothetical protein